MPKFYLTKNAAVLVESAGKTFAFTPVEYFPPTSSWWGTYATSSEEEIAALSDIVGKRDVEEISEEDYNIYEVKKKKASGYGNLINLPSKLPPQTAASSGKPAVVVDEPGQRSSDQIPVESLEEAIEARPVPSRRKSK